MSEAIQIWNRLESRTRTNSFTRSLRAEVRDALWMITRQWQFGELNGNDTGTAAFAMLDMQTSRINRIAKAGDTAVAIDENVPLECLVERETVKTDLLHRIELGRQFLKMLKAGLSAGDYTTVLSALQNTTILKFDVPGTPATEPAFHSSPELLQATMAIGNGLAIDGFRIIEKQKVYAQAVGAYVTLGALASAVNAIGTSFVAWYDNMYSQPGSPAEDYWLQQHLEYQFVCSAPLNANDYTMLTAKEYYSGRLDWHSFDIQDMYTAVSVTAGFPLTDVMDQKPFTVIPSKISFGGMPAPRFWEMEDRRVDFGNMRASTTDTAQLLMAEFANIYSNDWTIVPYTVPTGSICNLRKILVTDVFGQTTYIRPACADDWTMYTLSTNGQSLGDTRLFVPPVVANMQESESLETVTFLRDEMANMVWGIETVVPDGVDSGQNGKEAAQRLTALLEGITPVIPQSTIPNTAEIKYNIMNKVPENWIPYIPVSMGNPLVNRNIQFQRASMPRTINNNPATTRVRPRTTLLQAGANVAATIWTPSYIYEEEIPRSGVILSMTWQRARWHNGRVALWLGRRKQNGRGEGYSGLQFDYLTAK